MIHSFHFDLAAMIILPTVVINVTLTPNIFAGTLSDEGISTFSNIAARDAFLDRMNSDNFMLIAENEGKVEGVIELKEGRHVAMLFIRPERQKSGIGRKLLLSALNHAKVETVTVSASLSSVPAYEKYGFECNGEVGESASLVYQPMELKLNRQCTRQARDCDVRHYVQIPEHFELWTKTYLKNTLNTPTQKRRLQFFL